MKHIKAKTKLMSLEAALVQLKEKHQAAEQKLSDQIRDAVLAYQEVCPHENIKKEDSFNYHTREDWTTETCADCGKYLRKY